MADAIVVTCPECAKKIKPQNDVRGKKIKCPGCAHAFVVPAVKDVKTGNGKSAPPKDGKPKPKDAKAAPIPPETKADPDDENDPSAYGVKHVEMVPRCPNCTTEMGPHDIICLECGYNTLTRQWGKTEKTRGVTGSRHFMYLLPALGSAVFVVGAVVGLIFYATVGPYLLEGTMFSFLDSEAMRMWTTVLMLGAIFSGGVFCIKKFIEKPKPDEVQMD